MRWRIAVLMLVAGVSRAQGQATLTGYVREDSTNWVMPGAEISIKALGRSTRAEATGRYSLRDIPLGAHAIEVRAVGYVPLDTVVQLTGDADRIFHLRRRQVRLDTVSVTGRRGPPGSGFDGFEERRANGLGKFIDSLSLRRNDGRTLDGMLREFQNIQVMTPTPCLGGDRGMCARKVVTGRKFGITSVCTMEVVLDGVLVGRSDNIALDGGALSHAQWQQAFDVASLSASMLNGVEVYRSISEAPGAWASSTSTCGLMLIWSRRG